MNNLEIPMLVKQNDYPTIPLFDSTKLHVSQHVSFLERVFAMMSTSSIYLIII